MTKQQELDPIDQAEKLATQWIAENNVPTSQRSAPSWMYDHSAFCAGHASRDAEVEELKKELERLKQPHAHDCSFLFGLRMHKDDRWDCDCDASEIKELRAKLKVCEEALQAIKDGGVEHGVPAGCVQRMLKQCEIAGDALAKIRGGGV